MSSRKREKKDRERSGFYAVRTTAGQELNVALLIENRARYSKLDVRSIIVSPSVKGYVIIEAGGLHVVYEAVRDIKHVKPQAPVMIPRDDIERILIPKPVIEGLEEGDIVEIIGGPFRGMKAKILRVEVAKNEVILNILESAYPLQITVPGDYVKLVRKRE